MTKAILAIIVASILTSPSQALGVNTSSASISSDRTINIALQPKQAELVELVEGSQATVIGYGGARGGGKSYGGRTAIYLRRLWYPNTNALIFRRTWDDVRENHLKPFFLEHPSLKRHYRSQEHTIYIPDTGSEIVFGTSEHEQDVLKYHGKAYADILVDESQLCTEWMLQKLKESNRCTRNQRILPKMILMMNPGGMNHAYHKRVFIDKEYIENEKADDFAFLEAHGWDNVQWVLKALAQDNLTPDDFYGWDGKTRLQYFITRSDYGQKLASLPDSDRKAQLFGDWDIFEGQFFSMWRKAIHVIPAFTPPPQWEKLGVIDYGQRTVLEIQTTDHEANVINFAECYTEHKVPEDRFNAMADLLIERKLDNLLIHCDTNMGISMKEIYGFDKTPLAIAQEVFEQRMKGKAPTLIIVSKATHDKRGYRAVCNEAMKQHLSWKRDEATGELTRLPKFRVTENCPMLIKTLPALVHDPAHDGLDFDQKIGIDDPFDAAKMGLMVSISTRPEVKQREFKDYDEYMQEVVFKELQDKAFSKKSKGWDKR